MMKYWNKLPSIVRGLVIGFLIQIVGIMPLFTLIQMNVESSPAFPWAVLAGGGILFVLWKFLSGQQLFFSSSPERRDLSRTKRIVPGAFPLMLLSGVSLAITLMAFVFLGYMLAEVPLHQIEFLAALKEIPLWSSLSLLFIASLATGVIEEVAWRGYAQRIIERHHTPFLAISVVALVFTIIHFLPLEVWPLFILGSLGWGFFAYYSNSILPGIIFHTLIDLTAFIWAMFNLETLESILKYNVFEDGINSLFSILGAIACISAALTVISFKRLRGLKLFKV